MSRPFAVAALLFAACSPASAPAPEADSAGGALVEGCPDALGILGFLDSAAATEPVLDVNVGLDKRAATNIVAHVDGADGVRGTADDRPLATVAELDAIAYVGASAIAKLTAYVEANGLVPQVVEGVAFTTAQATAALNVANHATQQQLDVDAGLDARAATNIVAARPIADLPALAAVKYVGASALQHLRDYAPNWQPSGCILALADSVDRDAADLNQLLAIATTIDTPAFEILRLHVVGCPGALDPANQAKLVAALTARVNWGYAPGSDVPFHDGAVVAGDADYLSDLNGAEQVINDHVADGTWVPSTNPNGAALYARLGALIAALSPASASGRSELTIVLEADECSQRATVVIDAATLELYVVHKFSEC